MKHLSLALVLAGTLIVVLTACDGSNAQRVEATAGNVTCAVQDIMAKKAEIAGEVAETAVVVTGTMTQSDIDSGKAAIRQVATAAEEPIRNAKAAVGVGDCHAMGSAAVAAGRSILSNLKQ